MDPYDHDLERGMRNRRALLGDDWVDQSVAKANAFTADFQNFITRYAWHEVWGRPGLDAPTRRIIVLAITCALGRWDEFELHLRAALTGGNGTGLGHGTRGDEPTRLTPEQVKEVLMQTAIYAGVPAANTGMAIAARLLRELGHDLPARAATEVAHTGIGRSLRIGGSPALHATVREPREAAVGSARPPTVVMSHSLSLDVSMWDALANALAQQHRVICYDHRGHGDSDVPPGPYTMADFTDDAERLLDELAPGEPVIWIGLSLGAMVGQELALRAPRRLRALVLADSTAVFDAPGRAAWQQRMDAVDRDGFEAVADSSMARWFSPTFHAAQPAAVARWRRRLVTQPRAGYLAAARAVMNVDTTEGLADIDIPTLVIVGSEDQGTPVAMAQALAAQIPKARLVVLQGASHVSVIDQPGAFEAAVRGLIETL